MTERKHHGFIVHIFQNIFINQNLQAGGELVIRWEEFVKDVFAYLENLSAGSALRGCPFAVMGMELAFQRPEIAKSYLNGLTQFQALFRGVLLQSGLSQPHADVLSERLIAVYQGNLLLGRISQERGYLGCAKESMLQMYKEYRAVYGIASSEE